jgi:hypothetical protein
MLYNRIYLQKSVKQLVIKAVLQQCTGYFKTSWKGATITPARNKVTLSKKDDGIASGGLYR